MTTFKTAKLLEYKNAQMDIENSKDILFYSQQIERKNLIRMED